MEIANLVFAAMLILAVSVHGINSQKSKADENKETAKPSPNFNPLEDLILNQDKNGFKPGASLSRVKRQYRRYPPYPIPIIIGGGFGGYGGGFGRGFGGRGFGGRGFGGRGFGGRGFGGRGFGGGIGGRGIGGGFGGGRGGGGGRG